MFTAVDCVFEKRTRASGVIFGKCRLSSRVPEESVGEIMVERCVFRDCAVKGITVTGSCPVFSFFLGLFLFCFLFWL